MIPLSSTPNPEILKDLVTTRMPFGKFKGLLICDLPITYLEWFSRKGFPEGKLGMLISTAHEIQLNGLTEIIYELKKRYGK